MSSLDIPWALPETEGMTFSVVIAAAGTGSRAGAGPAKQWRLLAGKPVLLWAVEGLAAAGPEAIVVAVGAGEEAQAEELLSAIPSVRVVIGGANRAQSVCAGLDVLAPKKPDFVLIHDAARPFVSAGHIWPLLAALTKADGAVPVLPLSDTLKRAGADGALSTLPRDGLLSVQTPQAFRYAALVSAHAAWTGEAPTDDAAMVEAMGGRIVAVQGDPMLMKLTYPEDFAMAEVLAGAARITRVGQGYDAHRFGSGDGVWLCGVLIPHDQALVGHSDADAGLHALVDALLGAIGAGDIGQHFPPSDPQWKGVSSDRFVRHAVDLVRAKGGQILNADVTLICEAPRVGPHREAMRAKLAELLDLPIDRVGVKATTTEGMGFTGRREGLAAQAIVAVSTP